MIQTDIETVNNIINISIFKIFKRPRIHPEFKHVFDCEYRFTVNCGIIAAAFNYSTIRLDNPYVLCTRCLYSTW